MKKIAFSLITLVFSIILSCVSAPSATSSDRLKRIQYDYDKVFDAVKITLFDLGYNIKILKKDEGYIEALTRYSTFAGPVWKQHKILLMKEGETTKIRVSIDLISGPIKNEGPKSFYDEFWQALQQYL